MSDYYNVYSGNDEHDFLPETHASRLNTEGTVNPLPISMSSSPFCFCRSMLRSGNVASSLHSWLNLQHQRRPRYANSPKDQEEIPIEDAIPETWMGSISATPSIYDVREVRLQAHLAPMPQHFFANSPPAQHSHSGHLQVPAHRPFLDSSSQSNVVFTGCRTVADPPHLRLGSATLPNNSSAVASSPTLYH
jgi:hypothetical protein